MNAVSGGPPPLGSPLAPASLEGLLSAASASAPASTAFATVKSAENDDDGPADEVADGMGEEGGEEECATQFGAASWLARNPLEAATERENAVLKGLGATSTVNGACFRACFRPVADARAHGAE